MHDVVAAALAFLQVVFIDLVLAGDNVIVVGLAAAGLPAEQRRKAILIGVGAATVLRIGLALFATMLLAIVGLTLAGGILLLWVCWKMFREMREAAPVESLASGVPGTPARGKSLRQAVLQIVLADLSMSVDNVLAVAGAAHDHPIVLVFGLGLSVVLMGVAASMIARLLERHRWVGYIGLAIIVFVASNMIYHGSLEAGSALHIMTFR